MRRFSIFQPLWMAFYSKDLYVDVGRNWTGVAFGYLALLLAVAWIPAMVKTYSELKKGIREDAPPVIAQLPTIKIQGGKLETDPPGRHEIVDPKSGKIILVLDPDAETPPAEPTNEVLIFTRTQMILRQAGRDQVYQLAQLGNYTVTQETARRFLDGLLTWLTPLMYLCAFLGSFIFRMLQSLLYGALGSLISESLKKRLDYQALVRLAVMALTPVVWLNTVQEVVGMDTRWFWWWPICFVVAMYYLYFGIKANADAPPAAASGPMPPPLSPA